MDLEENIKHCVVIHKTTRDSLLRVLKNRGFKVGVEIGVQYGINSERLLDAGVAEKLYGIDPFNTKFYPISPISGRDEEIYNRTLERLSRFGNRYVHIRKPSNDAILDIKGKIDFIYIDGGKSKTNIVDDITFWYPKLNYGGIMCGNDYNHSSYPWITRFLKSVFNKINVEDGDLWWVQKEKGTRPDKISVVTPFYNTGDFADTLIAPIVNDDRIDEMIIVDDCSKLEEYEKLKSKVGSCSKINVVRNEENLGEFKNRIKATKLAKNDWVIFLDGDNALVPSYLDEIYSIPYWREDVIYCPDYGTNRKIDYRVFSGDYIGLDNLISYLDGDNRYVFSLFLGTGNYFMNRKKYLEVAVPIREIDKKSYGDYFFSIEWMKRYYMFFVPGMSYIHRLRKDSEWMENKHSIQRQYHRTIKGIREYKRNKLRDQYPPMMSNEEIDYIDNLIEELKPKNCLEWGSGNSTIYFPSKHDCIENWVSYEHSRKWFSYVNARMNRSKVELKLRDRERYLEVTGKYDLILVDGEYRKECLNLARNLLNDNGVVLLHDSARDHYEEELSHYEHKEIITGGEITVGGDVHRGLTKLWL